MILVFTKKGLTGFDLFSGENLIIFYVVGLINGKVRIFKKF